MAVTNFSLALATIGLVFSSASLEATQLLGLQQYNASGDVLGFRDGAGVARSAETLNIDGSLKHTVDALGQQFTNHYNSFGQLAQASVQHPSDTVGHLAEDHDGQAPIATPAIDYTYDQTTHRLRSIQQGHNQITVSFRRACVTRLPNPCKFYFYLQEKIYARAYP